MPQLVLKFLVFIWYAVSSSSPWVVWRPANGRWSVCGAVRQPTTTLVVVGGRVWSTTLATSSVHTISRAMRVAMVRYEWFQVEYYTKSAKKTESATPYIRRRDHTCAYSPAHGRHSANVRERTRRLRRLLLLDTASDKRIYRPKTAHGRILRLVCDESRRVANQQQTPLNASRCAFITVDRLIV